MVRLFAPTTCPRRCVIKAVVRRASDPPRHTNAPMDSKRPKRKSSGHSNVNFCWTSSSVIMDIWVAWPRMRRRSEDDRAHGEKTRPPRPLLGFRLPRTPLHSIPLLWDIVVPSNGNRDPIVSHCCCAKNVRRMGPPWLPTASSRISDLFHARCFNAFSMSLSNRNQGPIFALYKTISFENVSIRMNC